MYFDRINLSAKCAVDLLGHDIRKSVISSTRPIQNDGLLFQYVQFPNHHKILSAGTLYEEKCKFGDNIISIDGVMRSQIITHVVKIISYLGQKKLILWKA